MPIFVGWKVSMQALKLTIFILFLANTYLLGQQGRQCSIEKFAIVKSDTPLFSQQSLKTRPTIIENLKKGEIVEIVQMETQPLICNLEFSQTKNFQLEKAEKRRAELADELFSLRVKYTDDYPRVKEILFQLQNLDNYINSLRQNSSSIKTGETVRIRSKRGKIGFVLPYTLELKFKKYCPKNYKCSDIDTIIQLLVVNSITFEKGKFEKTADWKERMKTVLSNIKLDNSQTLANEFTFAFNFPIASSYDADKEKYSITILTTSDDGKLAIPIFTTVPINFLLAKSNKIIFSNLDSSNVFRSKLENIELSISISRAKLIDENFGIAFSGKIVYPFLSSNKEDIWFELNKLIVFDTKTGEIYKEESQMKDTKE